MKPAADDRTLLDLFRSEVETQAAVLSAGLLALEDGGSQRERLTELMRAAHSLKGAARIVQRDAAVRVAHTMEDWFVAAQDGRLAIGAARVDSLLEAVDLLKAIAELSDEEAASASADVARRLHDIAQRFDGNRDRPIPATVAGEHPPPEQEPVPGPAAPPVAPPASAPARAADLGLRIGAGHLDRLLALSGETLVASRWIGSFGAALLRMKRLEAAVLRQYDVLSEALQNGHDAGRSRELEGLKKTLAQWHDASGRLLADYDGFDRRFSNLADRLQREVMDCRMRPFGDGAQAFPRVVRDAARSLGRDVRLEVLGETTPVDRMLLERLDAPLGHLLRNAVDHGIEPPDEREAAGKPRRGTVRIEARCSGGKLLIVVADDGRGIDPERIRRAVVERKLLTAEPAGALDDAELFEFLFLPGFSLKGSVTEISGRGVGLDVVQTMARQVGASVRISSRPGEGTEVQLHLPLTLSVVRAVIAEIAGEPYAFPLARIAGVAQVCRDAVRSVEGRQHVVIGGESLGLVAGRQVLGFDTPAPAEGDLSIIVLGDRSTRVGVVVDRLAGEGELVTRPLDARLKKVKDISAGALMPDGSPVLVIDAEDLMRSIEKLIVTGGLERCDVAGDSGRGARQKRVLVVDDSLTVRELERKLLVAAGYEVAVAVDGMDGWNAVRSSTFDLVVTDVDMPRVDGIELVSLIRRDARLRSLPVMIISYKDRDEDRRRGLEAGADYYLPKASFHDDALVSAVHDLIGAAA